MVKYRLIFVLIIVLILLTIVAGLYFYPFSSKKQNIVNTTSPSPTKPATSVVYHIPTLNSLPVGTINEATKGTSFILAAKIDSVSKDKDGNVKAHISYKVQNGQGADTSSDIHLFSKDAPGKVITITFQRKPVFFPTSADSNTTTIDLQNNLQKFIDLVNKYHGTNFIFTFLEDNSNSKSRVQQQNLSKQAEFMSEVIACNTGFLSYLKTGQSMPPCIPYSMQLNIYNPTL